MSKINLQIGRKPTGRSCDGCTKCCDGWLTANIHGEEMYPGKPCQFVESGVGCTIYDKRPKDPCKGFVCMWKAVDEVPEEFKPSEIGAILHRQEIGRISYLNITEAGNLLDPKLLSWFVTYCVERKINAHWTVDGKAFWMGESDFSELMMKRYFD